MSRTNEHPTGPATTRDQAPAGRGRGHLAAVVTPAAAALVTWLVAVPLAGVDLRADTGAAITEVGPVAVVVSALVVAGAAIGLQALLRRLLGRAATVWRTIAIIALVLSLPGPLTMATNAAAAAVLVALHVVVGVAVILQVPRLPERNPAGGPR